MTDIPWNMQDYKAMMRTKGRLLPIVEQVVAKEAALKNSHRDTKHLHPSELSKKDWCARAAVYKINDAPGADESVAFGRLNIFAEGNAIHEKWQTWLWKAGILSGVWTCKACGVAWIAVSPTTCVSCKSDRVKYGEVPLSNDEYRILGHADGEIHDKSGTALIEIKSVGIGTVRFERPSLFMDYSKGELTIDKVWKEIKTPFASHIRQGNIYMYCTGIDTMVFIYEWKPTQEVKEFVVKYNPDVMEPILKNCKTVIAHLENETTPERPDWATGSSCSGCKFCPYKKGCWK